YIYIYTHTDTTHSHIYIHTHRHSPRHTTLSPTRYTPVCVMMWADRLVCLENVLSQMSHWKGRAERDEGAGREGKRPRPAPTPRDDAEEEGKEEEEEKAADEEEEEEEVAGVVGVGVVAA
ncbi:hypothetical protein Ahia01_001177900, partial [Argonauta hians]